MKKILTTILLLISFILPAFAEDNKKNTDDCVNIAFTIDKNYDVYTMLTIQSMMRNKNPETNYKFYILEDNLTKLQKKRMAKFAKNNNTDITFYHVSTESFDEGRHIYGYLPRITPIGMARILLPSVMPNEIKKVLYLDSDIYVATDLKELYDTDLENYYVGMVKNHEPMNYEIFKFGQNYYNSGVILMDLEKLRKAGIEDKMITYLKDNWQNFDYAKRDKKAKIPTKFMYPDQDLISLVLYGKIKPLDSKWNIQGAKNEKNKNKNKNKKRDEDITENRQGIFHFIGSIKPWTLRNKSSYMHKIYFKDWLHSPLCIYIPMCWHISRSKDKITVYKDIIKLYKNEY